MNIIYFLFKLLHRFGLLMPDEYARLKQEAEDWYASIRFDVKSIEEVKADKKAAWYEIWMMRFKAKASKWYVAVGFAVAYIFVERWVHEYMHPDDREEEDDDGQVY